MERPEVTDEEIDRAFVEVRDAMRLRLIQHGYGSFASRSEACAIIEEEAREMWDALRKNDLDDFLDEVQDVAVGCIFAIACRRHMKRRVAVPTKGTK